MTLVGLGLPQVAVEHARLAAAGADATELQSLLGAPDDDRSGVLLLTCDEPGEERQSHRAGVVRALSERADVAVLALSEPPSRIALLMRCLDFVSPYLPVADLHAVAPAVNGALRTLALVDGVSGLRRPAPSVVQHGLGLVPGSRFAVDLEAGTVGAPNTLDAVTKSLPANPVATSAVVVAADTWYPLLPGAPAEPTVMLRDVPPRTFWGARRWAELTVLTEPLETVVERALQQPARPCTGCARQVRQATCPFCGVVPGQPGPHVSTSPLPNHDEVPAL
ncbi:hypothetical protein ACPPVT_18425 [Angustibacter sp. McL0619]|uniref:hypothetical protein n=1 Tax=Angustibacter sp. McL0619 TaxID=3415676 RepID=UPI003CF18498